MPLFETISSFFGNNASSSRQARRAAVNSTFDAFSLPQNTRYDLPNGSDTDTPGPSRRASAYTYPPQETYTPSSNLYPPLSLTFDRLRASLTQSFPELLETLNGPVDPTLLAAFEREIGSPLPPAVRDTLLIADGQDLDSGCAGLFFGLYFLPLDEVIREWQFWRRAESDPEAGQNPAILATMASVPPSWIKGLYACRGWLPLISDRTGNYVGVDLDPGPGGSYGQVIVFGRDFDRKCVLWRGDGTSGWGKWLAGFVDELESGEGWEADRSSDEEEEELGYSTYNNGAQAGEGGKGLRLAGEYRGWNVLEAWWDRSVRQWEQLGQGLDVEEIERGLNEARRLAGWDEVPERGAPVEVPVIGSPQLEPPSTPIPEDSDILLPPASPEQPSRLSAKKPNRNLLTPPDSRRRRAPPPAPTPLDLPTRADVQAMSAIAEAEASGLRGGWVMNIDTRRPRHSQDEEMVDIDLEGGRAQKFGANWDRAAEDRSGYPLIHARTPSPLSRGPSVEEPPIASGTMDTLRQPPVARSAEPLRTRKADEDRDGVVVRNAPRTERESSVVSTGSQDGLLDRLPSRTPSPDHFADPLTSPTTIKGRTSNESDRYTRLRINGLEEGMEEVSLRDIKEGQVMG